MPITNPKKFSADANGDLSDLISLGKWKQGIVNRVNEYEVPNDALLDALNLNITNGGAVRTRDGQIKVLDGNCHSIHTFKNHIYFVKDNFFSRIDKNGVVENLIPDFLDKVYYVEVASELYLCSGDRTYRINQFGGTDYWGINSPDVECEVVIGEPDSGSMKKGKYRINYSYLVDNYESGIYPLDTVVDVPYDNFKIEVTCIPTSQSTAANFYISSVNGEELYLAKTSDDYTAEIDYYDKISKSPKIHSEAFPSLENICYANGRIWGTSGAYIFFSNDRDYRQHNPSLNLSVDGSNIVLFVAVDNGLYIVTELGTYFMTVTNPEVLANAELRKIFDYSAIKGTLTVEDKTVSWLSSEGYIVGDNSGRLENKTKEKISFSKNYTEGASIIVKKDGIIQTLFALKQQGDKTALQTYDKNEED